MEPAKEIETVLIQAKKYTTFLWPFMFGGGGLTIFFGSQLRSEPFMLLGLAIFVVAPLALNRPVRSFFTKRARVQFFPDRLIIEVVNDDTDVLERTDEYAFADMVNYRTDESAKNNSSYFSMRFSDGRKVSYTFWPPQKPAREDEVTYNLGTFIKAFNARPGGGHTIAYRYMWFESHYEPYGKKP
jgi:hypothetical protein